MVNKIRELDGYGEFLKGLKEKIAQAQVKAALAVSHELVKLYGILVEKFCSNSR